MRLRELSSFRTLCGTADQHLERSLIAIASTTALNRQLSWARGSHLLQKKKIGHASPVSQDGYGGVPRAFYYLVQRHLVRPDHPVANTVSLMYY